MKQVILSYGPFFMISLARAACKVPPGLRLMRRIPFWKDAVTLRVTYHNCKHTASYDLIWAVWIFDLMILPSLGEEMAFGNISILVERNRFDRKKYCVCVFVGDDPQLDWSGYEERGIESITTSLSDGKALMLLNWLANMIQAKRNKESSPSPEVHEDTG